MMRVIAGLILVASAYGCGVLLLRTDNPTAPPPVQPQALEQNAAPPQVQNKSKRAAPSCPDIGRAFAISPASLHSIHDIVPAVAAARMSALSDLNATLQKANSGDGIAALAVLSLLRGCRSIAKNFDVGGIAEDHFAQDPAMCSRVPRQVLEDPLAILLPAAQAGSSEAQLIFAMNAQAMANLLRLDPKTEPTQVTLLTERAARFAEEAAQRGLQEAFTFLASAHYRGAFSQKEPVLAYAYASFISGARPSPLPAEAVDHIYRAITRDQLQQARRLISSCSATGSNTGGDSAAVLLNPF